jgi:hypothetical protein
MRILRNRSIINNDNEIQWSRRRQNTGNFYNVKNKIRTILNKLSGNEIVNMLKDLLNKEELHSLASKYVNVLSEYSTHINENIKMKEKHNFIRPLRNNGFRLNEIKEMGFNCGDVLWQTCLNRNARNKGGRPMLDIAIRNSIEEFLESKTSIAANYMIDKKVGMPLRVQAPIRKIRNRRNKRFAYKTIPVNVRNLDITKKYANLQYNNQTEGKKLSYSTFIKYIDSKYKKIRRYTDLCIKYYFK